MNAHKIREWLEPTPCVVEEAIRAACSGDSFLAEVLLRRGFTNPNRIRAFLSSELYVSSLPNELPDLVTGALLLQDAITSKQHILIWGDFDVDGQTSTALLVDGLQRLGANVSFFVPDRAVDSHGIKLPTFKQQVELHEPDLLITCDTGISEFEALEYAHTIGLPVIVTDHHETAEYLPPAAAIINPRLLHRSHPLANLPGVGVAYKLIQHIYAVLGREQETDSLLDLVALGIVGDVATQTDDTRYLLQRGLERLRNTERIGLKALIEVANLTPSGLTGERIAYQITPRLNAAGRLANAALSVELLITDNSSRARIIAQQLEGLNNERRVLTRQMEISAEAMINANPALLDSAALVLYQPEWHPGIIGIVASHLAERYARPVVLLSGSEGGIARGSARAPGGSYDINKTLMMLSDLLRSYGGHPGAAGLSLEVRHIDRFRERFSLALAEMGITGTRPLVIDAILPLDQLTLDLAQRIQRLAPFGEGNNQIILATKGVKLSHAAVIGRESIHRRLTIENSTGRQQIVLWWHSTTEELPDGYFDLAYNISVNDRQELQLSLVDYRLRNDLNVEVKAPDVQLFDWRNSHSPTDKMRELTSQLPDCVVWAEGLSRTQYPDWKRRAELIPTRNLLIFTIPPDPQTLRDAIDRVQPETVHFFALQPPIARMETLVSLLEKAIQNVVEHHHGETTVDVLGGAVAASPQVVRAALDHLAANGKLTFTASGKQKLRIGNKTESSTLAPDIALARLQSAYQEMTAYRRYYIQTLLDRLLI